MFKSSFKEGEAIKSTPKALIEVDFKSRSSWDNDDDSLEWLPDDWLKNHGPPEDGTMHGSDDEDVTNTKGWQVVKVTDAGCGFLSLLFSCCPY